MQELPKVDPGGQGRRGPDLVFGGLLVQGSEGVCGMR